MGWKMTDDYFYFEKRFKDVHHKTGSDLVAGKRRSALVAKRALWAIGGSGAALFLAATLALPSQFYGLSAVGALLAVVWAFSYPLVSEWDRKLIRQQEEFEQALLQAKIDAENLRQQKEFKDSAEPNEWLLNRVRPTPQPYGVSDQGAEHLVAEWLHYLGFEDAQVTQYSGDGGIDVETIEHVVQVKNYRDKAVSVTEVRELFGVAASERKRAVLFTSSSCTSQAIEFADKNGIALIKFDSRQASLVELNDEGSDFLVNGDYEDE
jgi:hypothetical protein